MNKVNQSSCIGLVSSKDHYKRPNRVGIGGALKKGDIVRKWPVRNSFCRMSANENLDFNILKLNIFARTIE